MKAPQRLAPGLVLGGYRIDAPLGSGGMGHVYRATQLSLGRPVALKVLTPGLAFDKEARERFLQEGRLAARVAHPRLVRVLEVGQFEHRLFLAYELIEGGTLREKLHREGPLPLRGAIDVAVACAQVLAALHGAGVLHRDLKPENVFMSKDRGALVGDLGIAKDVERGGGVSTRQGLILGTPAYMAPELIYGKPATPASDVYALGILFFECLTGRTPFASKDPQQILTSHLKAPVPSAMEARPGLPESYDLLLETALAKEPSKRFGSAAQLAAALKELPVEEGSTGVARARSMDRTALDAGVAPLPARATGAATLLSGSRGQSRVAQPKAPDRRAAWAAAGLAVALLAAAGARVATRPSAVPVQVAEMVRPVAAKPAVAPAPKGPAKTAQDAARAREEAMRHLDALDRKLDELHEQNSRDIAKFDPAKGIAGQFGLWKEMLQTAERVAKAEAARLRAGEPGGAASAGRLLLRVYLTGDFGKLQFWDNMTAWQKATDPGGYALGSLKIDTMAAKLMELVSAECVAFTRRVPPELKDSTDPVWRAGLISIRCLSRHAVKPEELRELREELQQVVNTQLSNIDLSERAAGEDIALLSALLRALNWLGESRLMAKVTGQILERHPQLVTSEELNRMLTPETGATATVRRNLFQGLTPVEQLAAYEIWAVRARLTLRTNILEEDRAAKQQQALTVWTSLRDSLILGWPYDPRSPVPSNAPARAAELHQSVTARLSEARLFVGSTIRKADLPFPAEPAR